MQPQKVTSTPLLADIPIFSNHLVVSSGLHPSANGPQCSRKQVPNAYLIATRMKDTLCIYPTILLPLYSRFPASAWFSWARQRQTAKEMNTQQITQVTGSQMHTAG